MIVFGTGGKRSAKFRFEDVFDGKGQSGRRGRRRRRRRRRRHDGTLLLLLLLLLLHHHPSVEECGCGGVERMRVVAGETRRQERRRREASRRRAVGRRSGRRGAPRRAAPVAIRQHLRCCQIHLQMRKWMEIHFTGRLNRGGERGREEGGNDSTPLGFKN